MERIARFCIYLLDKILMENEFEDLFPTSLQMPWETLSPIFNNAFNELAEMSKRVKIGKDPIFNLVPVLGAGRSAAFTDDIITCELFARKS
ncbi:hypothetical protein L1049_019649 [Liquidambar formosana]|uniref:Uncharacterized protein n=1 Tax=Liquidambar formosana TaxID=63359 RepID=A0AAP0XAB3_LIQFO